MSEVLFPLITGAVGLGVSHALAYVVGRDRARRRAGKALEGATKASKTAQETHANVRPASGHAAVSSCRKLASNMMEDMFAYSNFYDFVHRRLSLLLFSIEANKHYATLHGKDEEWIDNRSAREKFAQALRSGGFCTSYVKDEKGSRLYITIWPNNYPWLADRPVPGHQKVEA